ncbi:MAG: 3-hexulose-6-phosphate synthase [Thermoprotei archaeon]|nr:MAG: 3-hexulose-6-phosphate synthase [Thermoprotei archaeon]
MVDINITRKNFSAYSFIEQGTVARVELQVALDFIRLEDALKIAEIVEDLVDILEAGTPLIKSEGLKSVKKLREKFPSKTILADMKTMDTGFLEVSLAAEHGADIVSILGAAPDATIISALEAAREKDVKVMVDLIGVKDKPGRARELEKIGVDYILVHVGIDEQRMGRDPLEDLKTISEVVDTKIAVAGGLTPEKIKRLKGYRVDVVIVGSYIMKSETPRLAAEKVREAVECLVK